MVRDFHLIRMNHFSIFIPYFIKELGQVKHQLSIRMTTEGNTWQKVWEQAQAVPVSRQKRLFDDTNEALKVLHYLETRKMHEIYNLTVIPLLHSAILKLAVSNSKLFKD